MLAKASNTPEQHLHNVQKFTDAQTLQESTVTDDRFYILLSPTIPSHLNVVARYTSFIKEGTILKQRFRPCFTRGEISITRILHQYLESGSPCERYRDPELLRKQHSGTVVLISLVF